MKHMSALLHGVNCVDLLFLGTSLSAPEKPLSTKSWDLFQITRSYPWALAPNPTCSTQGALDSDLMVADAPQGLGVQVSGLGVQVSGPTRRAATQNTRPCTPS